MWAEQAIFTSLPRRGKAGYHLVARSPGVTDAEAGALLTWSPSHGALIADPANRTSVNYHSLPGGRFALSRTCPGMAEYSGRGGSQLYTHILIIDEKTLKHTDNQPWVCYRDALALGYFRHAAEPDPRLRPVRLSTTHLLRNEAYWAERARTLGYTPLLGAVDRLAAGDYVELAHDGDRRLLAECLTALLPSEVRLNISFTTSLRRSVVRPYQLVLRNANDGA